MRKAKGLGRHKIKSVQPLETAPVIRATRVGNDGRRHVCYALPPNGRLVASGLGGFIGLHVEPLVQRRIRRASESMSMSQSAYIRLAILRALLADEVITRGEIADSAWIIKPPKRASD